MTDFHAAVIAGTGSSAGKTTWALALMSFFREKGLAVQPFKVGPDYIDPGFHHLTCKPRKSRNLDRFFLSEDYLKNCFLKNSEGADLSIVEGVMGLFDGREALTERGSTAEMAKILRLPIFLVVNAGGMARSAAAVVKGYQDFDRELNLSGIFLNEVGSAKHFAMLREAIEKETSVPVLGWLPKDPEISIPERYLGLKTALEKNGNEEKFSKLAELLQGRLDEKRFLEISKCVIARTIPERGRTKPASLASSAKPDGPASGQSQFLDCFLPAGRQAPFVWLAMTSHRNPRIGIAYDAAFSFYYEDNLDLLREAGAELVFFSPLADATLPEHLDALYLGGGFPELYAQTLSQNETLKKSIRKFHKEGKITYAECGGLIYLTEAVIDSGEREFPLVGLIPGKIRMASKLQNFGYHEIEALVSTFLFEKGMKLFSHEFHRSIWECARQENAVYLIGDRRIGERREGFYKENLLASYQHLHFGQHPGLAKNFVEAARLRSQTGAYAR